MILDCAGSSGVSTVSYKPIAVKLLIALSPRPRRWNLLIGRCCGMSAIPTPQREQWPLEPHIRQRLSINPVSGTKSSAHGAPTLALGRILLGAAIIPHLKQSALLYLMLVLLDVLVGVPTRKFSCTWQKSRDCFGIIVILPRQLKPSNLGPWISLPRVLAVMFSVSLRYSYELCSISCWQCRFLFVFR